MSRGRVRINLKNVNRLMKSPPVQAEVNKAAGRIAAAAGSKFQVHPSQHRWVARAFVELAPGEWATHRDRERLLSALDAAKR